MSEALKHAWHTLHSEEATANQPPAWRASHTALLVIAEAALRDLNSIATSLDALAKRHGHFDNVLPS